MRNEKISSILVYFTLFFNVIDIFVTIFFIKYGKYQENNPIMNYFLKMDGTMPFILTKTILVGGGAYLLLKYKSKLAAQIGSYVCFCFYWALVVQFFFFLTLK